MNEHSILLAVLEIDDPAERSAYLDRACAGDSTLRGQVEQLLKSHQESGKVTDRPAPERRAEELATPGKPGETRGDTPSDDTDIQELAFLIPTYDILGITDTLLQTANPDKVASHGDDVLAIKTLQNCHVLVVWLEIRIRFIEPKYSGFLIFQRDYFGS